jgi:hypothetical protein
VLHNNVRLTASSTGAHTTADVVQALACDPCKYQDTAKEAYTAAVVARVVRGTTRYLHKHRYNFACCHNGELTALQFFYWFFYETLSAFITQGITTGLVVRLTNNYISSSQGRHNFSHRYVLNGHWKLHKIQPKCMTFAHYKSISSWWPFICHSSLHRRPVHDHMLT